MNPNFQRIPIEESKQKIDEYFVPELSNHPPPPVLPRIAVHATENFVPKLSKIPYIHIRGFGNVELLQRTWYDTCISWFQPTPTYEVGHATEHFVPKLSTNYTTKNW